MLNKRQIKAAETRKLILEISKKLIIENGYNEVSVNQICKECKVAKGTFYIYFSSKSDIVKEILGDITKAIWDELYSSTYINSSEIIYTYHKIFMKQILEHGLQFTREFLIIIISEAINTRKQLNDHSRKISEFINEGVSSGEFRKDLDVEEKSNEYNLAIYTVLIDWCTREKDEIILIKSMEWIEEFIEKLK